VGRLESGSVTGSEQQSAHQMVYLKALVHLGIWAAAAGLMTALPWTTWSFETYFLLQAVLSLALHMARTEERGLGREQK
jgi:hypothetical protein